MKLNIDCVRDVLLEFEEFPIGNYNVSSFAKTVGKYGHENTLYTLAKLYEANYINGDIAADEGGYYHCLVIYDITFQGHEFLSTIREPNIWQRLKDATLEGGTASLKVIGDIALEVAKLAVSKKLGLH